MVVDVVKKYAYQIMLLPNKGELIFWIDLNTIPDDLYQRFIRECEIIKISKLRGNKVVVKIKATPNDLGEW